MEIFILSLQLVRLSAVVVGDSGVVGPWLVDPMSDRPGCGGEGEEDDDMDN